MVGILKPETTLDFDRTKISSTLCDKGAEIAVAFSVACAQRLINSLDRWEGAEVGFLVAQRALCGLRDYLLRGIPLPAGMESQLLSCIPDEDDGHDFFIAVLDDALAALVFAGRALTSSPEESSCAAAARAVDTAFRHASQKLNSDTLDKSTLNYLMQDVTVQEEIRRQDRDLIEISESSNAVHTIHQILGRATSESVIE